MHSASLNPYQGDLGEGDQECLVLNIFDILELNLDWLKDIRERCGVLVAIGGEICEESKRGADIS